MIQRVRTKVADVGVGNLIRMVGQRAADTLARQITPDAIRSYDLASRLVVCVPLVDECGAEFVRAQVARLARVAGPEQAVEVMVPTLTPLDLGVAAPTSLRVRVVQVDNPLMVVSIAAVYSNVIIDPASQAPLADDLRRLLDKLGVRPAASAQAVLDSLDRQGRQLAGSLRVTRPIYLQLAKRLASGHYGYREPLDWDIVAELPRKFELLSRTAMIDAPPFSSLFVGHGRLARQFGVGTKYGPRYFQGESLLDVGCDICGVRHYVGPSTRYVGVDMQGLADHYINLDKEELPFAERSFQTVLCYETLEHIQEIHHHVDRMLAIAGRYFVGSLYIESANNRGRSMSRSGEPVGNAHLPFAPVYDRHQWIFTFADALDFVYYRARRAGFRVVELNLFYDDRSTLLGRRKQARLLHAFRSGDIAYLGRNVTLLGFALERVQ